MFIFSIILFLIGYLFLLFGNTKNPNHDLIGLICTIIAFIIALYL
jgi:hypothetical protein